MNKRGFTLTEMLAVIVIIGVIITIAIPTINNMAKKNKEKEYTTYVKAVEAAILAYADMEIVGEDKQKGVGIKNLIAGGYLEENIETKLKTSKIRYKKDLTGKVTIYKDYKKEAKEVGIQLEFTDGWVCNKDECTTQK